jgi:hypothetical protein
MADYMEVLEAKMVADGYLKEGKLTVFSGVLFGQDQPYNYREAKRILRLAMDELRTRKDLAKELGVDLEAPGRPAITGEESSLVWDFLRFRGEAAKDPFTKHPHLALSIRSEDVFAFLTLPNGMKTSYRRSLIRLGPGGFRSLIGEVASRLTDALKEARGACPWMEVLQHRYLRHRSIPTVDAGLRFDLRTATQCEYPERGEWPKHQPEWLDAAFSAFQNKESNLQVALGAVFPYDSCSAVHSKACNRPVRGDMDCLQTADTGAGRVGRGCVHLCRYPRGRTTGSPGVEAGAERSESLDIGYDPCQAEGDAAAGSNSIPLLAQVSVQADLVSQPFP